MKTSIAAVVVLTLAALTHAFNPVVGCKGKATYKISFLNLLTPQNFGSLIPPTGLTFSPLAAVSHSNRLSFFTIRGYASKPVEIIAEQGVNSPFIRFAKKIRSRTGKVTSVADAGAPTLPGKKTTLTVSVNCMNPFVTMLGMIAPSPDWIVQINNRNMFDIEARKFIESARGDLIAYDTGVDDGREFTAPSDLSLDLPTNPRKNIAPLVEDETDRFEGRVVGKFFINRIN